MPGCCGRGAHLCWADWCGQQRRCSSSSWCCIRRCSSKPTAAHPTTTEPQHMSALAGSSALSITTGPCARTVQSNAMPDMKFAGAQLTLLGWPLTPLLSAGAAMLPCCHAACCAAEQAYKHSTRTAAHSLCRRGGWQAQQLTLPRSERCLPAATKTQQGQEQAWDRSIQLPYMLAGTGHCCNNAVSKLRVSCCRSTYCLLRVTACTQREAGAHKKAVTDAAHAAAIFICCGHLRLDPSIAVSPSAESVHSRQHA